MSEFNNNTFTEYNSWEQLTKFSYNCINYLLNNNESIWKLLYYMESDALEKPNLTVEQKRNLIYNGQVDSSSYRIFMNGGNNDAFTKECAILKIYPVISIPNNRVVGTTSICFDCFAHYKINTLNTYSTRILTMVQELIKYLNGTDVGGLGYLSLDRQVSNYNKIQFVLNDNKAYEGYSLIMSIRTV